jgi:hypothetical protein
MLLGKVKAREDIPCSSCGHYKQMAKTRNWLEINDIKSVLLPEELPEFAGR